MDPNELSRMVVYACKYLPKRKDFSHRMAERWTIIYMVIEYKITTAHAMPDAPYFSDVQQRKMLTSVPSSRHTFHRRIYILKEHR